MLEVSVGSAFEEDSQRLGRVRHFNSRESLAVSATFGPPARRVQRSPAALVGEVDQTVDSGQGDEVFDHVPLV